MDVSIQAGIVLFGGGGIITVIFSIFSFIFVSSQHKFNPMSILNRPIYHWICFKRSKTQTLV